MKYEYIHIEFCDWKIGKYFEIVNNQSAVENSNVLINSKKGLLNLPISFLKIPNKVFHEKICRYIAIWEKGIKSSIKVLYKITSVHLSSTLPEDGNPKFGKETRKNSVHDKSLPKKPINIKATSKQTQQIDTKSFLPNKILKNIKREIGKMKLKLTGGNRDLFMQSLLSAFYLTKV